MIGDPCEGIAKVYTFAYECGDGLVRENTIPGEASGRTINIDCTKVQGNITTILYVREVYNPINTYRVKILLLTKFIFF